MSGRRMTSRAMARTVWLALVVAGPVIVSAMVIGGPDGQGQAGDARMIKTAATVEVDGPLAFSLPDPALTWPALADVFAGNRLFTALWTAPPNPVLPDLDGLGPLFNADSCAACHVRNGRGTPPDESGPILAQPDDRFTPDTAAGYGMLARLPTDDIRAIPSSAYGSQIQDRAIADHPGLLPEGRVHIVWRESTGRFADGTPFRLRHPLVRVETPAPPPLPSGVPLSLRAAPAVIGVGYLDTLPSEIITRRADPDDRDGDGISGRAAWLEDASGRPRLGRFGWKASEPDLTSQIAAALLGDMGLTSSRRPGPVCTASQAACLAASDGGRPEVSDHQIALIGTYLAGLAVPARRDTDSPLVRSGESLFHSIGCAACHVPDPAADHPARPAEGGALPYTDLLLHDMGAGLDDGVAEGAARSGEWRTPPLWGVGRQFDVNMHTNYLHDGRARNLTEAIIWHDGEGGTARRAFMALPAADRAALLAFLASL